MIDVKRMLQVTIEQCHLNTVTDLGKCIITARRGYHKYLTLWYRVGIRCVNKDAVSSTTGLSAIPRASERRAWPPCIENKDSIPEPIAFIAEASRSLRHTCPIEALARSNAILDAVTGWTAGDGHLRS